MEIRCAWCEQSTTPGTRPQPGDTAVTHGICKRHADMLLAEMPSKSFPGVRILLVLRRGDTGLHDYLERNLAGVAGVKVILDRRESDRRHAEQDRGVERRRRERRRRIGEVSAFGHTVVRFGAGPARG